MYTSALAREVTETEIRYIYIYTVRDRTMMMTATMTMLLTTVYIHQVGTCKQNVRKQKQFGRYRYPRSYYLTCPTAS